MSEREVWKEHRPVAAGYPFSQDSLPGLHLKCKCGWTGHSEYWIGHLETAQSLVVTREPLAAPDPQPAPAGNLRSELIEELDRHNGTEDGDCRCGYTIPYKQTYTEHRVDMLLKVLERGERAAPADEGLRERCEGVVIRQIQKWLCSSDPLPDFQTGPHYVTAGAWAKDFGSELEQFVLSELSQKDREIELLKGQLEAEIVRHKGTQHQFQLYALRVSEQLADIIRMAEKVKR